MLRTTEEKSERARALKQRNTAMWDEAPDTGLLTLADCARLMKLSPRSALRIFRHEPGVILLRTPGSTKPIIRVPRAVYERVRRRSTSPWS